jgi:hypothetical protein
MIRHQSRIGKKETAFGVVISLLGLSALVIGCATATDSAILIREDSPSANLREAMVRALKSCHASQRIVASGRLIGKGSISFEAMSQAKPPSFSADFLSPLGNTVAVIETVGQQSSSETNQTTQIRCAGNCTESMGIPAALQALAALDFRNLICGSPAAEEIIVSENSWARVSADGAIQWTGRARFAGESASASVTVAEAGSCVDQETPSRLVKIQTELEFGWFFKERFVTESRGCLTEDPEAQKLAFNPASVRIWNPSKSKSQVDLSIKFHSVETN